MSTINNIVEKANFLRSIMVQGTMQQFEQAIAELPKTEPNWFLSTIDSLALTAVKALRNSLENESVDNLDYVDYQDALLNASWENPQIRFGVGAAYNWEKDEIDSEAILKTLAGKSTENFTTDLNSDLQKQIFTNLRGLLVLQTLSGGIAWVKQKGTLDSYQFTPVLMPAIQKILNQWPDEKDRIIEELRKPFSPYPLWTPKTERNEILEISGIKFNLNLNGMLVQGYFAIEFHPLVLDHEEQIAYHPIFAKIIFSKTPLGNERFYKPEPQHWPQEMRNSFWEQVANSVKEFLINLQLENLNERIKTTHKTIEKETHPKTTQTLPISLPQYTFMETRNMQIALADGRKLRRWEEIEGEIALRHVIKDSHIQTKLTAGYCLDWKDLPATYENLRTELQQCDLTTVLLLNVAVGCALERSQVTIPIDELCYKVGLTRREKVEREESRKKVWGWLLLFDSMTVHGKRPGKYRDPVTKKEMDLTSSDALIKIIGKRVVDKEQEKTSINNVPIEVSFVAGPWLDQWRNNSQVLQYFGDISKIAKISSGKPSGAWAQSIGLALNQLWREQASRTNIAYSGENNKKTINCQPFTRLQLLDLFPCEPQVNAILESSDPSRAQKYWQESVKILKRNGIIGHYKEIDQTPQKRKGWQKFWLEDQNLDIRPNSVDTNSIADLSKKAKKAKTSRTIKQRN